MLKYHPFQQSRQKDLADELQHSDERQNDQGDFPSDFLNILLTRPEYSRYFCAHFDAKSARVPVVVRALTEVSAAIVIEGPRHNITIREHFTCKFSNVVYCISCLRCQALYIGESGRMPRERTGEHPRAIKRNPPRFPLAEHFKKSGHGLDDMMVPNVKQCRGTNNARRRDEIRLIFFLSWHP